MTRDPSMQCKLEYRRSVQHSIVSFTATDTATAKGVQYLCYVAWPVDSTRFFPDQSEGKTGTTGTEVWRGAGAEACRPRKGCDVDGNRATISRAECFNDHAGACIRFTGYTGCQSAHLVSTAQARPSQGLGRMLCVA
ncbi:unnamed protein product [Diplocarpon coronariae]